MREQSGAAGGDVAAELSQHSLRQRIGLDLVRGSNSHGRWGVAQRACNLTLQQSVECEATHPALAPIAATDGMDGGEPCRLTGFPITLCNGFQKPLRRAHTAARSANQEGVAGPHQF